MSNRHTKEGHEARESAYRRFGREFVRLGRFAAPRSDDLAAILLKNHERH